MLYSNITQEFISRPVAGDFWLRVNTHQNVDSNKCLHLFRCCWIPLCIRLGHLFQLCVLVGFISYKVKEGRIPTQSEKVQWNSICSKLVDRGVSVKGWT